MNTNKLYKGDCLIESHKIESGSVDLILTDLPYGTVKGLGGDIKKYKRLSNSDWDNVIDTDKIMQIANRILRKNGKMVLTANQPFTTELISKAIPNLPHCYNMYWDKLHFANCLVSNKAPVSYIEDVLVFSKNYDLEGLHPLRDYFKNLFNFIGLKKKNIIEKIGQRADHCFRVNSSQFGLCTEKTYLELIEVFNINFVKEFKTFKELKDIEFKYQSRFNLWEGKKYKSNILKYKKDYDGHHPTQKPVLLLEDLIKTFSNENDLVVDLTMGSGSTGVACKNTNRNFIGIEMNEKYFKIAKQRINKKEQQNKLF
jgi:site-specific DNA-methyltransferase (adenine-specific)|tara:strand:- start:67 stop:1005 length:939 start_codon:yes stop_codon:yes gene_type:complete